MIITGLRPTRVVALPSTPAIAGIINHSTDPLSGAIGISPSLVRMSNGAVIRNLMGGTTKQPRHCSNRERFTLSIAHTNPNVTYHSLWGKRGVIAIGCYFLCC